MKKRICILCGNKKFAVQKTYDKVKIYRCQRCDLGTKDTSALETKHPKYSKKLREMLTILQNSVREGKIIEVGQKEGKKESLTIVYKQGKKIKEKKVNKKLIDFIATTKERFDLIIFADNFAWYKRPDTILKKTRTILLDRGIIFAVVPNHDSYPVNYLSKATSPYTFSQKSIKFLLKNTGYKLNYKTTFDSFSDIKKHSTGNPIWYLLSTPPYLVFRKVIWTLGWGGYIGVVAEKSSGYN